MQGAPDAYLTGEILIRPEVRTVSKEQEKQGQRVTDEGDLVGDGRIPHLQRRHSIFFAHTTSLYAAFLPHVWTVDTLASHRNHLMTRALITQDLNRQAI